HLRRRLRPHHRAGVLQRRRHRHGAREPAPHRSGDQRGSALEVTFVTADRTVWTGEAAQVVVPALDGSMGSLPQMRPTLPIPGTRAVGFIDQVGPVEAVAVEGGFVSVVAAVVTIGVDDAVVAEPATSPL